jgi:formylglycine-generating enzyme required for sulfatase activity
MQIRKMNRLTMKNNGFIKPDSVRKTCQRLIIIGLVLLFSCQSEKEKTEFPYSQWTLGTSGNNITWQFAEGLEYNNSFIKILEEENWEEWYQNLLQYRDLVRTKIGKENPWLSCEFPSKGETKIHFDKFSYQLKLQPGEEIELKGLSRSQTVPFTLYFDFDLKTKGEELSYVVRRKIVATDSLFINSSDDWTPFSKKIKIPEFSTDSFAIAPIVRLESVKSETKLFLKDIQLLAEKNPEREVLRQNIEKYIAEQAENNRLIVPDELAWNNENYLMGFVFMWDHTFWSPEKGEYLVDSYCKTLEKEFGGLQSVILWHSYPNIGIDERNQFDFFHALPGGIKGLKQVVDDFHRNGVKVFITYNPWDLDTRRPENDDFKELAKVIDQTGADGIFLDTWKSAKGSISIFETENSIRNEVAKYGRTVAFSSEILPEFKDLIGSDALTCSWGQEIEPFHYTDLSHQKWLMPTHKQHYIKRMTKERKPILSHTWINGQGIQLWENIFGTMNLWNSAHRQWLRKMNTIWKAYGKLYLTDDWKPFIPLDNKNVLASQWQADGNVITNFVDTTGIATTFNIEVAPGENLQFFDLWNGEELKSFKENGKSYVNIKVNDFGCLLQTSDVSEKLAGLLQFQKKEISTPLPVNDKYEQELSLKEPIKFTYKKTENSGFTPELLEVEGGLRTFTGKHIWREGRCYPNRDAKHNHDLVITFENGAQRITHTHQKNISSFALMPRVVTNRQFSDFLKSSGYKPRFPENFLKHWNGIICPDSILDEPVVYVSLEDARTFAEWAGMRLPTEWEWQLAAETLNDKFTFNEVFEWNESERFDGYNRFVTLRGGCSHWVTPSSWWYLPSAPYGERAGGPQKFDSHVKYFLMYPGIDRASTIGFRCILNN